MSQERQYLYVKVRAKLFKNGLVNTGMGRDFTLREFHCPGMENG